MYIEILWGHAAIQKFPVNGIWVFAHSARTIEVLRCAAKRVLPL